MSVRTMARVWEQSVHGSTELLMLLAIADFSDDDGRAYPSVRTLAEKCRMKPRNCQYILNALELSGELSILPNKGIRGTNLYRINLSSLGVQCSAGVQPVAGVQHSAQGGAIQCALGVHPIAYEPSVNHQDTSTTHIARNTQRSKTDDSVPDLFLEFWETYDKKIGRANSIKEWRRIKPDAELSRLIIASAKKYSSSREQQYRKDPERWLKGRMWQDEDHSGQSPTGSLPDFMKGAL